MDALYASYIPIFMHALVENYVYSAISYY